MGKDSSQENLRNLSYGKSLSVDYWTEPKLLQLATTIQPPLWPNQNIIEEVHELTTLTKAEMTALITDGTNN